MNQDHTNAHKKTPEKIKLNLVLKGLIILFMMVILYLYINSKKNVHTEVKLEEVSDSLASSHPSGSSDISDPSKKMPSNISSQEFNSVKDIYKNIFSSAAKELSPSDRAIFAEIFNDDRKIIRFIENPEIMIAAIYLPLLQNSLQKTQNMNKNDKIKLIQSFVGQSNHSDSGENEVYNSFIFFLNSKKDLQIFNINDSERSKIIKTLTDHTHFAKYYKFKNLKSKPY